MKRIKLLALFLAVGLFSCGEDDELIPNPGFIDNQVPSFTAKVDGVSFVGTRFLSVFNNGVASVSGFDGQGRELTVTVDSQKEGVYKIKLSESHLLKYWPDNATQDVNTLYSSQFDLDEIGEIEIITIDNQTDKIAGIFSGRVILDVSSTNPPDTILISEGKFSGIDISRF